MFHVAKHIYSYNPLPVAYKQQLYYIVAVSTG